MQRFIHILLVISALATVSCSGRSNINPNGKNETSGRAVYYWKTTFSLSANERAFLREHSIDKIYLRLFDVALEKSAKANDCEVVPIATTRFVDSVPDDIEIIPTVYITLEAMRFYESRENELSELITTRIMRMCSYHDIGPVHEVQFDCDWTAGSRDAYTSLCEYSKAILHAKGIVLSGTIRLHQIREATYPFDRGVVMLYNTGAIKDSDTRNSILSYDDVHKYLGVRRRTERFLSARKENCREIAFAYPLFRWSVVFDADGNFRFLMTRTEFNDIGQIEKCDDFHYSVREPVNLDGRWLSGGYTIRVEHSEVNEILRVKELAEKTVGRASNSNILYHLDSATLSNYSENDIEKILH